MQPSHRLALLASLLVSLLCAPPAAAAAPVPPKPLSESLRLDALAPGEGASPTDAALVSFVWAHSPDLAAARARYASAQADLVRGRLLPNPVAQLAVNTIPIGPTNPPGLDRLTQVPNASVSVSELFELGKRGPRATAYAKLREAAGLDALELLRTRTLELREKAAEVAAAALRVSALRSLAADAEKLAGLQAQRARLGDAPGIDADRAELERLKYAQGLGDAEEQLASGLLDCGALAGAPCEPFSNPERAQAFLEAEATRPVALPPLAERPDLRSLEASRAASEAQLRLARAHALPDLTVQAGYLHDRFVVSGNQENSVFAGVSLPLPLFDHGQADAEAALAARDAAAQSRDALVAVASASLPALSRRAAQLQTRREQLRARTLPLARKVVDELDRAVRAGGAGLAELLFAHRTLGELSLDEGDLALAAAKVHLAEARLSGAGPTELPNRTFDLNTDPSTDPSSQE